LSSFLNGKKKRQAEQAGKAMEGPQQGTTEGVRATRKKNSLDPCPFKKLKGPKQKNRQREKRGAPGSVRKEARLPR